MRRLLLMAVVLAIAGSASCFGGVITIGSQFEDGIQPVLSRNMSIVWNWDGDLTQTSPADSLTNWDATLGFSMSDTYEIVVQHMFPGHVGEGIGSPVTFGGLPVVPTPAVGTIFTQTQSIGHDGHTDVYSLTFDRRTLTTGDVTGVLGVVTLNGAHVPEPSSLALFGAVTLIGGVVKMRRRRKVSALPVNE